MGCRTRLLAVTNLFALASAALAQPPVVTEFAVNRLSPTPVRAAALLQPVPEKLPAPSPVLATSNVFPIDLATALRLANASNPTIAIAQTRVREALARVDLADTARLPNLVAGGNYFRHNGIDQNRRGDLFIVTRSNVFAGGGAALKMDLAEAIYQPLIARRMADAEAATAVATANNTQQDVVSAYFDMLQAYALLDINADMLSRDEQILKAAKAGEKEGLSKSAADVNRAETEVSLRKIDRLELQARVAAASARLVRQLLLDPNVTLVPADPAVVAIELVPTDLAIPQLVELSLRNRPELAAAASRLEAADIRARQARYAPFLPKLQADYLTGGFGGGTNSTVSNLEGRGDLNAQVYWELRGLGFGNLADVRLRDAERDRAALTGAAARAQVTAEVVEAVHFTAARRASIGEARKATDQALEMYRKLSATSFGMIGPKGQFDALEPLLAVQALTQARLQYLVAVVDYNRAQFRLLTAVGQSPEASQPATLASRP